MMSDHSCRRIRGQFPFMDRLIELRRGAKRYVEQFDTEAELDLDLEYDYVREPIHYQNRLHVGEPVWSFLCDVEVIQAALVVLKRTTEQLGSAGTALGSRLTFTAMYTNASIVIIREQVCKLRSKSVYVHIRDPQRKYSGYVVGMLSRRFASILEEYHATLLRLHAARQCEDAGGVEAALSSATQQLQEAVSTASYRARERNVDNLQMGILYDPSDAKNVSLQLLAQQLRPVLQAVCESAAQDSLLDQIERHYRRAPTYEDPEIAARKREQKQLWKERMKVLMKIPAFIIICLWFMYGPAELKYEHPRLRGGM